MLLAGVLAAALLSLISAGPAAARPARRVAAPVRYYLALGDSLAQGVQPNAQGVSLETAQGYADQLYAIERKHLRNLRLVKLGCPGESTTSMISGHGNDRNAALFHCRYSGGSQLAGAERFLRAHRKRRQVALVTLDIGANDVQSCADTATGSVDFACVQAGLAAVQQNLTTIATALHAAAAPGTRLVGMTLYDPFLAFYLKPATQALGALSDSLTKTFNGELANGFAAGGFRVAPVDSAFKTYDLTDMSPFMGVPLPLAAATVCSLTWNCTPPPVGPNIHANQAGCALMAQTLAGTAGKLP